MRYGSDTKLPFPSLTSTVNSVDSRPPPPDTVISFGNGCKIWMFSASEAVIDT